MKLQFFCARWGQEHIPWNEFCLKARLVGYDRVEARVPYDEEEKAIMQNALTGHELLLIAQYYQPFDKEFDAHYDNYEKHLRRMAAAQPLKINAQTGKDFFTATQNKKLFEKAAEISKEFHTPIVHETHRNRTLFAAHIAQSLLTENPLVHITADFSHWYTVAESLLEDQVDAVQLGCQRAHHIHARVGYEQSPQVNDPRAPEWNNHLHTYLQWWNTIIQNRRNEGQEAATITTEFGPLPYIPTLPYSKQPTSNQWDINLFMMQLLKTQHS